MVDAALAGFDQGEFIGRPDQRGVREKRDQSEREFEWQK
jgi:hypothetical protein